MAHDAGRGELWWKMPRGEAHSEIVALIKRIDQKQNQETDYSRFLKLLYNRNYSDLKPGRAMTYRPIFKDDPDRIIINVLLNIVETLGSKITTHRPRPRYMTVGGSWKTSRRAKRLQRFTEGVWHQEKTYRHTARSYKDCMWAGTGFVKVWPQVKPKRIVRIERVFPYEMFVDEQACLTSEPRSIFQRKYIPAEVLAAAYPARKGDIREAAQISAYARGANIYATDLVEVVEAWHERSADDAEDGRHTIAIDNATLYDRRNWPGRLPFATVRWTEMPIGYLGQGLVEQLRPLQGEVDKLAKRIQDAVQLFATAFCAFEEGSVDPDKLGNQMGVKIAVKPGAQLPQIVTPPSMNNQVFQYQDQLIQLEYQMSGVSQMTAAGIKPPGLEHAVAIREMRDVESERFGAQIRAWENLHLDVADLTTDAARDLYGGGEEATEYEVRYVGKRYYEIINWREVEMDKENYVLQVWPSSLLPASPAGKLATIQELMGAGLMDPQVGRMLLDMPDLEKAQSLDTARIEHIDHIVDKMLDNGEYSAPQPWHGVIIGIRRVGHHLLRGEMEGAPPDRLKLLRDWIREAEAMIPGLMQRDMALAQAEMPGPHPDVAPPGAPPPGGGQAPVMPEAMPAMPGPAPQG